MRHAAFPFTIGWVAAAALFSVNASSSPADANTANAAIERDVADVLRDSHYTFCHDAHSLSEDLQGACVYAEASGATCPAFAKACEGVKPGAPKNSSPLHLPAWATGVARLFFWMLLGGAVAWLVRQIVLQMRRGAAAENEEAREDEKPASSTESVPPVPRAVFDTDAGRLFTAARSAAAKGDVAGAVRFAHAALVRALEHGGYVRVDRSTTSGDYLRALRAEPELRDVFGGVARELERVEFGAQAPTPDKVGQLLARVEPIVRRVALTLALVVSFAASACTPSGTRGDLNDDSPIGASVLRKLLERRGATVVRRTEGLEELIDDGVDTVLLLDTSQLAEDDWLELDSFTDEGGTVVLAGLPDAMPAKWGIKGSEPQFCSSPSRLADHMAHQMENATTIAPGRARLAGRARVLHLDPSFQPEIVCDDGPLLATSEKGKGKVVVISDRDFISNASMAAGDHARVLLPLFGSPKRVDVVDRFLRAEGATDPYRAVAHSGLAPALLHALAWLVLLAFALGKSFGTPRDPVDPPRRAFSDHVRAVGRLYELAGASRHALGIYAAWAIEQLNARLRPGGAQRMLDLSSAVSQRTRRPEGKIAAVLANATDARDRPDGPNTPAEDLAILQSLDEFLREIGGRR